MIQGQMDYQYVSTLDVDLKQRELLKNVLDLYDEEASIVDVMEQTGRYVVSADKEFSFWVNERKHSAGTVNAIEAAPVAGATTVVALTGGSVKPRVTDIMLTAGGYRSLVTAVSGNDVTVKPLNSAAIAHEALAVNDKVIFFSNAYAEGTGVERGYNYGITKYTNNIQIIKGNYSVTDLEVKTKVEVEFEGKNYYFIKGVNDMFLRFKMDIAYTHLLGEKSASLTDDGGATVYTTQGLEKAIRGNGVVLPLDTSTFTTFRDTFKTFNRGLDQARGPREYWQWAGADMDNYIDDWLGQLTETINGGINYNSFGTGDSKKKSIDLGFNSYRIYGRTHHKKRIDALDNPELTAAAGFPYPDMLFMIPTGKVKCEGTKEMKERFRIRYIESVADRRVMQEGPTKYHEILTGGLAPVPTNNQMTLDVSYATWQGPEYLGLEHFGITTL